MQGHLLGSYIILVKEIRYTLHHRTNAVHFKWNRLQYFFGFMYKAYKTGRNQNRHHSSKESKYHQDMFHSQHKTYALDKKPTDKKTYISDDTCGHLSDIPLKPNCYRCRKLRLTSNEKIIDRRFTSTRHVVLWSCCHWSRSSWVTVIVLSRYMSYYDTLLSLQWFKMISNTIF